VEEVCLQEKKREQHRMKRKKEGLGGEGICYIPILGTVADTQWALTKYLLHELLQSRRQGTGSYLYTDPNTIPALV
jgi:hypothetical protein